MAKTEKQTTIPATKAHVVTKTVVTCDFCSKQITRGGYGFRGSCVLCKRDICRDCYRSDPHDPGDYPSNYCPSCYSIKYCKYGDRQGMIDGANWDAQEKLDESVRAESLGELIPFPPPSDIDQEFLKLYRRVQKAIYPWKEEDAQEHPH